MLGRTFDLIVWTSACTVVWPIASHFQTSYNDADCLRFAMAVAALHLTFDLICKLCCSSVQHQHQIPHRDIWFSLQWSKYCFLGLLPIKGNVKTLLGFVKSKECYYDFSPGIRKTNFVPSEPRFSNRCEIGNFGREIEEGRIKSSCKRLFND